MKKSHPRSSSSGAILVAALLCFLLSVCGGLAVAAAGEGDPFSANAPLLPASDPALAGNQLPTGPVTDPAAAEELPRSQLDRAEAEDLLTAVFPTALEEPAGIFNYLEVEEFHSDHVAVVAPADSSGPPGLLSSLLPLRTEDAEGQKAPVDLELEHVDGELEPSNPLVEVGIPINLTEGITLPESGIGITVAGAGAERSGSTIGTEAAFYPNIATDTDLSAVPTPTGVETFTTLRSPEAPQSQTFHLSLPPGAELSADADGGASVTQAGDPLLTVQPPSAIDAEGNAVPVSLDVASDSLTLRVDPPAEAAFPILLDPVYESYSWMNTGSNTGIYSDWRAASSNEAILKPSWIGVWNSTMHAGLNLRSYAGAVAPGSQANWNYYVPRFFSDYENPEVHERPTSFIRNMTLSQVYFLIEEGSPHSNPYMLVGLWDENKGEFASLGTHNSAEGAYNGVTIQAPNPGEYSDVKNGGIALATSEATSYPRQAFVGSATVEISDKDSPAFGSISSPVGWMNESAGSPISYAVSDPGLGIYALQVKQPKNVGGSSQITTSNQCLGTAGNPCPRTAQSAGRTIAYEPKSMPQGENWLQVTATDPVGHQSAVAEVRAKVDHTAPSLALSGNLTEQGTVGTKLTSYALNYAAADGDEAAATATTPIGTTGTGTGQMQRPMGVAVDSSGNVWMVDRENNRVEEFSAKGEFIRQLGSLGSGNGQLSDPRGIAISSAGNVWVSELGNKRLQEFNGKGEFIRTITYGGVGGFVEPLAIATGPEETLWVTDIGAHKVFQFKENGTFVRSISTVNLNPGSVTFTTPTGIAVDRYGDAYIAEQASNQVVELSPTGGFIQKFGSTGTGEGQFKAPNGIAIAASGNVFVVDAENNRVQEFKPDGSFLRQFASPGTATNQLAEPRGIAIAPGNEVLIADAANHRLARWTHADKDPQSGAAKVEVKVDGSAAKSEAPGCSTKNCQINGSWTLNADSYPRGSHKVEVLATDGVGLTTTKTLNIETHGDYAAPQIALSGSMTEQATLGTTRPTYKLRAAATDPGSAEERKSGVASETIKFDGTVVDSSSPGCPAEGCSLTREWTLESSTKSVGAHKLEVTATDAAGHTTTKTLEIKIERDTTAPVLETGSEKLFTAPGGWLEQKSYSYIAAATDNNGYGVTSLQLKIDGTVVKSASGTCSAGGCEKLLMSSVNMASYSGGSHAAELVATDGAGNVRKRNWTINVDPSGSISHPEAEETLEAVENTSESNLLGPTEEEFYEGTAPGLTFESEGSAYSVAGSETPTSVSAAPKEGLTIGIPNESSLDIACQEETEPLASELTGKEEEALAEHQEVACTTTVPEAELLPVEITPASTSTEATASVSTEEAATVTANQKENVDLITRPLFDGAMTFAAIRSASAPTEYSWTVQLEEEQDLRLVDPDHAVVEYAGGQQAFTISAIPAHDAIGTTVPTSLSVTGNLLTLTVDHHAPDPAGGSFVYPIVGGAGWEGGFETYQIEMPEGEELPEEEGVAEASSIAIFTFGPPTVAPEGAPGWSIEPREDTPLERRFKFTYCWPKHIPGSPAPPGSVDFSKRANITPEASECHREDFEGLHWATTVHGHYEYKTHNWVWVKGFHCGKWAEEQPVKVHCKAIPEGKTSGPADVVGEYRFHPGQGSWEWADKPTCLVWGGKIFPREAPKETKPYERPAVWEPVPLTYSQEPCDWEAYERNALG